MGIGLRIWEVIDLLGNVVSRSDDSESFPTFPTILTSIMETFFLEVKSCFTTESYGEMG